MIDNWKQALLSAGLDTFEISDDLLTELSYAATDELRALVRDLSDALTDEGSNWSNDGLSNLRRRVADALPSNECPDWLLEYRRVRQ